MKKLEKLSFIWRGREKTGAKAKMNMTSEHLLSGYKIRFDPGADYNNVLAKHKTYFEKKWKDNKPSRSDILKDYEIFQTLGVGAFGTVKLVRHKQSSQYYALKLLSKEQIIKHKQLIHTINEKKILLAIDFPFLVSMELAFKDNTYVYFRMPFINGGEMFTHLRNSRKFEENISKFYAAQVVLALEYLHYLSLIYRDLKPENIMIDSKGYLKITDFGFCKFVEGRTWTLCGTPEYLAPEIIQNKGYGKSVDWWSFGVLIYEMCAGYSPFYVNSSDPMVLFDKIVKGKYKTPVHFGEDLKNLCQNLLQLDLTRRFGNLKNGANDIKQHVWFKQTNWVAIYNQEMEAPFIPKTSGAGDTSNFDKQDVFILRKHSKCLYEKEFNDF